MSPINNYIGCADGYILIPSIRANVEWTTSPSLDQELQ